MKNPNVAFILSFFLPGAGLAYLGKWKWGFINLGIVLLIGAAAVLMLSDEFFKMYSHYIGTGCAGGSGGLALAVATQMNQKKDKTDAGV